MIQFISFLIKISILFSTIISSNASLAANFIDSICSNTMMFANNSKYQTNLNTLFHYLTSNATNRYGYHAATAGVGTNDVVYGHFLCRGDESNNSCQDCVKQAITTDLPIKCPDSKVAIIWYDECMVRYSNVSFFGIFDYDPGYTLSNPQNVTGNVSQFMYITNGMLKNIASQAASGGSDIKYGTGRVVFTGSVTVYGLVQCTPDLSSSDCKRCLVDVIAEFPICMGSRIVRPSCNARFETFQFFYGNVNVMGTVPLSLPPYPPPTSNATGTGTGTRTGTGMVILSPSSTPSRNSSGRKNFSTKVLVSITIAALLVVSTTLCSICIRLLKKRARKLDVNLSTHVETPLIGNEEFTVESLQYNLAMLVNATNNFSDENKLGQGGFGSVYKGILSNGKLVAVKRLSASSSQGVQEFETEVLVVAMLQHRNLVRLLGFCYTEQEKLLVYEYVANKSLDNFIFDHEQRQQLDWQKRYNIIKGIARGLLYLHHDSRLRIIHRDLKASNILLDEKMNPKISDFGTSRIFGVDHSQCNYTNKVVGTYGYMAPEYALHGQFSIKSDAFSFGVLVLEIISGRKASPFINPVDEAEYLLTQAWRLWEDRTPLQFVDPIIRDSCLGNSDVMRCIQLGLLCVQESVQDRPTMANVVLTLDSYSVTIPIPKQTEHSSSKSIPLSVYEDSVTELEPR